MLSTRTRLSWTRQAAASALGWTRTMESSPGACVRRRSQGAACDVNERRISLKCAIEGRRLRAQREPANGQKVAVARGTFGPATQTPSPGGRWTLAGEGINQSPFLGGPMSWPPSAFPVHR